MMNLSSSVPKLPFACLVVALLALPALAQEGPGGLPAGPGAELVFSKCQGCHSLRYVTDSAGLPPFLWEDTVHEMIRNGLEVTDEERETIIEYLGTYLGPNPPEPAADAAGGADAEGGSGADAQAEADAAEEADGAAVYASNCASCHQAEGQGVPGAFPPLAGHARELAAAEGGRAYLADVLLYGLRGEIEVDGTAYDGVMPAWAHLDDARIAAVLNHVVALGEGEATVEPFTAEEIAAQRGKDLGASQVREARPPVAEGE